MATNSIKFKYGAREIDLSEEGGVYWNVEFVPSHTVFSNLMTGGKTEGELIERVPLNRKFTFTIGISGDSSGEIEYHARLLEGFINQGTTQEPVVLHVRMTDDYDFEPLWGQQGAYVRYNVISGSVIPHDASAGRISSATKPHWTVELFVKPFAEGLEQQLAQATGGIYEDTVGKPDGISRGLVVAPASVNTGNYVTNPIFDHPTDWDNGWTTGATITLTKNTDSNYILFGSASAKVLSEDTSSTRWIADSITAANTNTHCFSVYAKKHNGGTITNEVNLTYGPSGISETVDYVGNGWYRVWGTAAGVASGQNFGIYTDGPGAIYYDGAQAEEGSYPTPVMCGDFLGNAWAGTAHESASTRTAGRVRVDATKIFDNAEATVRMVVLPHVSSTETSDEFRLFTIDTGTATYCRYQGGNDSLNMSDGTTAVGDTISFSAYEPFVAHCTVGPDGLAIYKDGVSLDTDATYTPQAAGTWFYIGTDASTANHFAGTVLGCTTFPQAMTAAEVTADYNNVTELLNSTDPGKTHRVDWIPWEWTKDGDSIIDAVNDSDDDNFMIVNGIPGSYDAKTYMQAELITGDFGADSVAGAFLSFLQTDEFIDPGDLYLDETGTVDAACSSGEYQASIAVSTSWVSMNSTTFTVPAKVVPYLFGKEVAILMHIEEPSANDLEIAWSYAVNSDPIQSFSKDANLTQNDFQNRLTRSQVIPDLSKLFDHLGNQAFIIAALGKRDSGSSAVNFDYMQVVPRPYIRIWSDSNSAEDGFYYRSTHRQVLNTNVSTDSMQSWSMYATGDRPELQPDKFNAVIVALGDINSNSTEHLASWTLDVDFIKVVPRYVIL